MEQSVQFLKVFEKEQVLALAKKSTAKMFEKYLLKEQKAEEKDYSDKSIAIVKFVKNNDFGCKSDSVIKLCELLTGESMMGLFEKKAKDSTLYHEFEWVLFACFVTIEDADGYDKNQVLMTTNDTGYVFTVYGMQHNDIDEYCEEEYDNDFMNSNYVRPANDEEIEVFVDELFKFL